MFLDKYVNKHLIAWLSYNAAYQDNYGQANHICYVAPQYIVKGNNYQHIETTEFPNEGCIEVRLQNNAIAEDVLQNLGHLVKITINAEPYFNENNTHVYNIKYNASYGKRSDLFMESFNGNGLYQIIDISSSIDVLLRERNFYQPQVPIYTSAILLRNGNVVYGPFDSDLNGLKIFDYYVGEYSVLKFASELITIQDEHQDTAAILLPRNFICAPDKCAKHYDFISDTVLINSFIDTLRVQNQYTKDQISQLKTITQALNNVSDVSYSPERLTKLKQLLTHIKINTSCCDEVLEYIIKNEFTSPLIVKSLVTNHFDEIKDKLLEFSSIKQDLAELQKQKSSLNSEIAKLQESKQNAEHTLQELQAQSRELLDHNQAQAVQVLEQTQVQTASANVDLEISNLIDKALADPNSVHTSQAEAFDPNSLSPLAIVSNASNGGNLTSAQAKSQSPGQNLGWGHGQGQSPAQDQSQNQGYAQSQVQGQSLNQSQNQILEQVSELTSDSFASAQTITPAQAQNLVLMQAQQALSNVPGLSSSDDENKFNIVESLEKLSEWCDDDKALAEKIDVAKAHETLLNLSNANPLEATQHPSYRPDFNLEPTIRHSREQMIDEDGAFNTCNVGKNMEAQVDINAVNTLKDDTAGVKLYPDPSELHDLDNDAVNSQKQEQIQAQDQTQAQDKDQAQTQDLTQDPPLFQAQAHQDENADFGASACMNTGMGTSMDAEAQNQVTINNHGQTITSPATASLAQDSIQVQDGNMSQAYAYAPEVSDATYASYAAYATNTTNQGNMQSTMTVAKNVGSAPVPQAVYSVQPTVIVAPAPVISEQTLQKLEQLVQLYKQSQQTIAQLTKSQSQHQDHLNELQSALAKKDEEIKSLAGRLEVSSSYFDLTKKLTRLQEKYNETEQKYESMRLSKQQELDNLKQQGSQVINDLATQAKQTVHLLDNKLVTQLMHSLDEEPAEIPVKFDPQILHSHLNAEQIIDRVYQFLKQAHRNPTRNEVANYLICLTQGFITTFAGEPGTGKTSLCNLLAKALGLTTTDEHNRFVEVAVERGWSSCKDLIGYYNPLTKTVVKSNIGVYNAFATLDVEASALIAVEEQHAQSLAEADTNAATNKKSETSGTTLANSKSQNAKAKADKTAGYKTVDNMPTYKSDDPASTKIPVYAPFIVLLDEANLSPIEHYWATFLKNCDMQSSTHREISLGGNCSFKLPEHLRFFATVNFDHTTEELSPRFLDRSWIIMLDPNQIEPELVDEQLENTPDMVSFDDLKEAFSVKPDDKLDAELAKKLEDIQAIFRDESIAMPIMPRSLKMVRNYCIVASKCMERKTTETRLAPLDYAFAQKVLPTLNGSGESHKKLINALLETCSDNTMPLSAKHLKRMARIAERNMGFYQFFAR